MILTLLNNYVNELTAVYGVPSSGKTSLCLQAALHHAQQGKKVIFIDTEKGFSIERFKQLAGPDYPKYLDNIILFTPKSFKDQHTKIQLLPELIATGNIALIIVDTIGYYYRRFMKNRPELGNSMLKKQIGILQQLAKHVPVLVSNQVYTNVHNNTITMVGGQILPRRSDRIIQLEKEPQRKLIVKKPEEQELLFTITDRGFTF